MVDTPTLFHELITNLNQIIMKKIFIIFVLTEIIIEDPKNANLTIKTTVLVETSREDTEQLALLYCMDLLEKEYNEAPPEFVIQGALVKIV